jgi:hypothetical protein
MTSRPCVKKHLHLPLIVQRKPSQLAGLSICFNIDRHCQVLRLKGNALTIKENGELRLVTIRYGQAQQYALEKGKHVVIWKSRPPA